MAPKTIDYSNTCFYKICCKDLEITDIYVGHTTDFIRRKQRHKYYCNCETNKNYNQYVYKFIRDNCGWGNFDMVLIEKMSCANKLEALKKEREYIEVLNAKLNKNIPSRTKKEYNKDNDEHLKEQNKQYRENNKEQINEQRQQYRDNNREKLRDKQKQYQESHKENYKQYYENNKEQIKENGSNIAKIIKND